jgi:hypothetical protein
MFEGHLDAAALGDDPLENRTIVRRLSAVQSAETHCIPDAVILFTPLLITAGELREPIANR